MARSVILGSSSPAAAHCELDQDLFVALDLICLREAHRSPTSSRSRTRASLVDLPRAEFEITHIALIVWIERGGASESLACSSLVAKLVSHDTERALIVRCLGLKANRLFSHP